MQAGREGGRDLICGPVVSPGCVGIPSASPWQRQRRRRRQQQAASLTDHAKLASPHHTTTPLAALCTSLACSFRLKHRQCFRCCLLQGISLFLFLAPSLFLGGERWGRCNYRYLKMRTTFQDEKPGEISDLICRCGLSLCVCVCADICVCVMVD